MSHLLNNKKEATEKIAQFLQSFGPFKSHDLLIDSIRTLMRSHTVNTTSSDFCLINTALNEIRESLKVFSPFKSYRKVCLFGSARTKEDQPHFQMAEAFSKKITQKGYMLITGAGGGIMEAGNKGSEPNMDFGVNIDLPFEQSANPYIADDPKLVNYHYFFNRKLFFVKESDATVLFPGGYGTHDEGFEILTLIQTGRCAPRPIILVCTEESRYWDDWEIFVEDQLLKQGLISPEDKSLYTICHDINEAVATIEKFYSVYHSIRYLENETVIRLNTPLPKTYIDTLNKNFSDILKSGEFKLKTIDDIPEEKDLFPDQHRLCFHFNTYNFGRLFQLINFINGSA